jgi:hypothetical protein
MRRILRHRPSPAMVIACIALGVALGGTSVAAVNALPRNSVGTKQLKKNAVTSPKVKNRSLLAVDFKAGQLPRGAQGPTGPTGPTGATGATGAQGIQGPLGPGARWALIRADGVILDQSGGISVTSSMNAGSYWINMGTDVSRQLILTTIRGFDGYAQAVYCGGPNNTGCNPGDDANHVFVYTHNAAGSPTDRDFWVTAVGPGGVGAVAPEKPEGGSNPARVDH